MGRINQTDRSAQLRALEGQQFDLLVIGGGITGVGVARDAAMRGLSVALIEAQDCASNALSASITYFRRRAPSPRHWRIR